MEFLTAYEIRCGTISALSAGGSSTQEEITIDSTVIVPIEEKLNLTLTEAAMYSGVGINKIRDISNDPNCPFVLWVGSKRLIKRKKFAEYLEHAFSI